ncbi:MAG: hypothetical protein MMC33_004285 [Icmadophila ericetorum]|nr:hypothetical protein [Icmadophila ericetorum]
MPLLRCTAAWGAVPPSRASQQASEQPGHLAGDSAERSMPRAPLVRSLGSQQGDSPLCDESACLDGLEDLQLPQLAEPSEHEVRLAHDLGGEWETDIGEEGNEHELTEEEGTREQTGLWSHAKVE